MHEDERQRGRRGWYRRRGKRFVDVALAGTGIVISAPVMLAVAVMVRKEMGAPVLFRQERPGKDGEPFVLLKFRTMKDAEDAQGKILPDEKRITSFGSWLRSTSLDELPSLWNVLRGEMSLVGPRPLLMEYLPRYSPQQARRHEVLPGLTGLAQVRGRNALTWAQKFDLDVQYVDSVGALQDFAILVETLRVALLREGVAADGHVTMPFFQGSTGQG